MKIAIMGYGTIGSGVMEVLKTNGGVIASRVGEPIEVKKVLDLRDFEGDPVQPLVVHDYMDIVNDDEIVMVVETMGGVEPAYTFVKAMLEKGKAVTTSNKALVADKGAELLRIAAECGTNFMFEASVGGGIPIIRTILACLTGDVIEEITGIVNGTTNYMMTKMMREGSDFDAVLKEAQANGYAEKDPTADIEGLDACRKIAILTSIVAGAQVDYEDIPTEGISKITQTDILYANKMHRMIKLLADSKAVGDTYSCRVAPFLVAQEHPLYAVNDVFNAVFVKGNMLGESMYYGSGAGSLPTASAVVGDLVRMAKHLDRVIPIEWREEKVVLADEKEQRYAHFIRSTADKKAIETAFAQVDFIDAGVEGEIGFVTPVMSEREFDKCAASLGEGAVVGHIRIA
ncbi:MAG: homoserine dehydrogenase [Lachnospiraceae bacterium]|nr:homoserine dehydrogenase [Lachnospiraceae bacterium]